MNKATIINHAVRLVNIAKREWLTTGRKYSHSISIILTIGWFECVRFT
jgi:hypothetical protein